MWGRYAVPSRSTSKSTMHSAELEALAQTFREQLRAHTPDDVGYFDSEVQLLRALHNEGGRQHPRTLDAVLRAVRLAQGEVWQT